MFIEISIGEALDRLSILEIKLKKIVKKEKLLCISKEIQTLNELIPYKEKYSYYYSLLLDVNTQIWDKTNSVKETTPTTLTYGETAHEIFTLNDSRFRLKCIINELSSALIKEQKSYSSSEIEIVLQENDGIDIEKFTLLSLNYDRVIIICSISMKNTFIQSVPAFNYEFRLLDTISL